MLEQRLFVTIVVESIGIQVISWERIDLIVKQLVVISSTQAMELHILNLLNSLAWADSGGSLAVIHDAEKYIVADGDKTKRAFDIQGWQGAVVLHVDFLPWREFYDTSWRSAVG